MQVTIVAAVARGGVIGRAGSIPWRIPEDLARFRELTSGHAVVMGRRTWDSLPARFRPLPGRRNVVVTRNGAWSARGAERAGSVEDALTLLEGEREAFVIGGAEIYAAALPLADELALTEIDADVGGDAHFPEWDRGAFVEVSREERTSADGVRFAFVVYRRLELTREPRGGQHVATMSTEMRAARDTLDASLPSLRELSTERGTLELIVVRPAEGERETPASAELTVEEGLVGDRWRPHHVDGNGNLSRADQLTVMSTRMLELIAEPERWPLAGDNLLVDMGLDAGTLPAGSRLAIGDTVVIQISEEPHTGCAKFSARFGSDALKFVNSPQGRELRLRGALARVVVPGPVATGDAVRRV